MDDYNLPPQGPPAYALESSSSEDEWDEELQDIDPRRHQATRRQAKPEPVVQVHGSVATGTNVVFLVGEAGERVAKGVAMTNDASAGAAATVTVDGVQVNTVPRPCRSLSDRLTRNRSSLRSSHNHHRLRSSFCRKSSRSSRYTRLPLQCSPLWRLQRRQQ